MKLDEIEKMTNAKLIDTIKEKLNKGEEVPLKKLKKAIQEIYSEDSIEKASLPLYESLIKDAPKMYEYHRLEILGFESRLQQRWLDALYTLQSIITIAEEVSMSILDEYIEDFKHEDGKIVVPIELDILAKLHARAIVIGKEVFTLLKSGFADAAISRWRGLHEINVIFTILTDTLKENESLGKELAYRFLDSATIEQFKIIHRENIISKEFGKDYKEIKSEKEDIERKYGKSFSKPYEWARPLFENKRMDQSIYFSDLEQTAEITNLTSYYKQANSQIHSTAFGLYRSLGSIYNEKIDTIGAVFGPSNYGLSIPGQLTVGSVAGSTISFLLVNPTLDKLIISNILQLMVKDAQENFDRIQNEILNEELSQLDE
ncbi:hypothetical protein DZB84_04635 [Bacillus sp. HNG]|uniref:DUF5677 domain-containing protein n=1 Tax=Bacillus sp. HNG TaxID=2293325 RepID=UPI000E2F019A|nr:DUF5677 domain-containing protein [Bacillus sp. HNG]RFB18206.1 hypothetical protein DZB84_04635 [Bacillus sp. HNG]